MFVDGMRVSVASRHIHQEYFISYRSWSWILEVNGTLDAVEQGNSPDLGCWVVVTLQSELCNDVQSVPFIIPHIYVVPKTMAGLPHPEHLLVHIINFSSTMSVYALSSFIARMKVPSVDPRFSSVFPLSQYLWVHYRWLGLFRKYFVAFESTELLLGAAEYLRQASSNTGRAFECHSQLVVCDRLCADWVVREVGIVKRLYSWNCD